MRGIKESSMGHSSDTNLQSKMGAGFPLDLMAYVPKGEMGGVHIQLSLHVWKRVDATIDTTCTS